MGLRLKNSPSDIFFEGRDAPPTHYSFKFNSFSSLSKASIDRFCSDKFEAGDYKWKLSVFPNGNKDRGGEGHISINLTLVDTSLLPAGWEVKAIFNLLVFDQIHDKYFTISDGKVRRFHAMKTEWGIAQFIELEIFNDSSNGYLINDTCIFGVDVFVMKQTRKGEYLSLTADPVTDSYFWKIKSLSARTLDCYESKAFTVGDYKWRIRLYPRGNGEGKGNSISVFLTLDEATILPDTKIYAKFSIRVIDQTEIEPEHFEHKGDNHFGPSCLVWGAQKFMSLAKLNDQKKGFLVDDSFTIKAQITLVGIVTPVMCHGMAKIIATRARRPVT